MQPGLMLRTDDLAVGCISIHRMHASVRLTECPAAMHCLLHVDSLLIECATMRAYKLPTSRLRCRRLRAASSSAV